MSNSSRRRRSLLACFPGQPTPRLYDRVVEVLRVLHHTQLRVKDFDLAPAAHGSFGIARLQPMNLLSYPQDPAEKVDRGCRRSFVCMDIERRWL